MGINTIARHVDNVAEMFNFFSLGRATGLAAANVVGSDNTLGSSEYKTI